jgi:hypothetical protein
VTPSDRYRYGDIRAKATTDTDGLHDLDLVVVVVLIVMRGSHGITNSVYLTATHTCR